MTVIHQTSVPQVHGVYIQFRLFGGYFGLDCISDPADLDLFQSMRLEATIAGFTLSFMAVRARGNRPAQSMRRFLIYKVCSVFHLSATMDILTFFPW